MVADCGAIKTPSPNTFQQPFPSFLLVFLIVVRAKGLEQHGIELNRTSPLF